MGYGRAGSPLLPTKNISPRRSSGGVGFPKRHVRIGFLVLVSLCAFALFHGCEKTEPEADSLRDPRLYDKFHEYEANLPQHNLDLPYPEGRDAKFFWASNHVADTGWGNAMQELLMNAHLAYVTKRAFVFDNFTWERDVPEYPVYDEKLMPIRIPLSSMISGPLIGGPFEPGDDAPRAVSKNYFNEVCPPSKRTIINTQEVNDDNIRYSRTTGASFMFDRWVEKLNSIDNPCVEIARDSSQLFEIWVFGSRRILDIWPSLSQSPVLKQFAWSPLIHSAFKDNIHLFQPSSWSSWLSSFSSVAPFMITPPDELDEPFPGLLVLHIRRGDFQDHCVHLAKWASDWNGFNAFPSLPDKFTPPPGGGGGSTTPENKEMYLKHCFPTIQQIVDKVTEVQKVSEGLRNVYVMTNELVPWLEELKTELMKVHKWDQVASTSDLELSWEQRHVAQTIDMMIGQRAQAFIGNGFSSVTSNVVMLRMLKGIPPESNRFW